ncbi:hypothetical protein ISN39_13640 [Rhizobium sp. 007]|nr:hypothetical protein ISN39_13640 [Rhizobium sp. 007]
MGYILRANRKACEGINHPARDAQFGYINDRVKEALAVAEPAISVDTRRRNWSETSRMAAQKADIDIELRRVGRIGRKDPVERRILVGREHKAEGAARFRRHCRPLRLRSWYSKLLPMPRPMIGGRLETMTLASRMA